jgi:alpha-D-ribose 1-methylphosphonate 5-triphosphate synthase subunit PhnG
MSDSQANQERARWLGLLARADRRELEQAWAAIPDPPDITLLRGPETGLVMMRGRMGGVGRRFNVGEVTVTRCAVRSGNLIGHGYVQGRDRHKAELVARLDLLLQMEERKEGLMRQVVEPLSEAQRQRREAVARKAAATRVDFFTLVRGEDK